MLYELSFVLIQLSGTKVSLNKNIITIPLTRLKFKLLSWRGYNCSDVRTEAFLFLRLPLVEVP